MSRFLFMIFGIDRFRQTKYYKKMYCWCDEIEELFLDWVINHVEADDRTEAEIAKEMFPDVESSANKWQRIKNHSRNGKKQGLKLAETCRMCQVLGADFPSVMWEICNELKKDSPPKQPQKKTFRVA